MRKFIIGVLTAYAMVMLAVPAFAHADSQDDSFLKAVSSRGITAPPDQLIAAAHAICDVVGTPAALGPMTNLMAAGLSPQQAGEVMLDGTRAYCPNKNPFAAFAPGALPPGLS